VKLLVKAGGSLLDQPDSRARLASELAGISRDGVRLVVVHGGGKQMTRFLSERGIESRFVRGLRVTTPEIIDAVVKVFAGSVNHEFVAALVAAGGRAVGLSGIDAALVEAEQLDPELGAVGRPVRNNPALLDLLVDSGFLPVVACVAGDREGKIYNVNADQMAVSCAIGYGAEQLLFLTDVEGVRDRDEAVIPHLDTTAAQALIASKVAVGGMEAKLNAAITAVENGVGAVRIVPGAVPNVVSRVLAGEKIGTEVTAGSGGSPRC
jgi:acetylglutamate kinase